MYNLFSFRSMSELVVYLNEFKITCNNVITINQNINGIIELVYWTDVVNNYDNS